MNLRELFDDQSAHAPPTVSAAGRLAGARRRVVARRRARLSAAATAVALVAGIGVGVAVLGGSDEATPADPIEGYSEYLDGNRILAADAGRLDQQLTVTLTLSGDRLVTYWRCDGGRSDHVLEPLELHLTVTDGQEMNVSGRLDCSGPPENYPDLWPALDLPAGQPVTVTATISPPPGGFPAWADRVTWRLAAGEPVPFAQYEFPSRPADLPPLQRPEEHCDYPVQVDSDPADPNRPVTVGIPFGAYRVDVFTRTPGQLTVAVADIEVGRAELWEYGPRPHREIQLDPPTLRGDGVTATDGDPVPLTLVPAHMTGEWLAALTPARGYECN